MTEVDYQAVKVEIDRRLWHAFGVIAAKKGEYKRDLLNSVLREFIEKEGEGI